ncbi:iron uptake transporter permease EfeU [Tessaracoccus palaemonis]|uniref:FTR1 family protein n=1 Tax=Tessaracoccus palaemonis TaxID=2829499 RepID=A0ABX8SKV4_9ACTN|nr:iron uptake transporter permease EfeU [Tessaracoccus palaemonis]QXT64011.1 FTR1 family protein [Tessaracoccus palaemonis]
MFVATFLIGLREGLEASLIIGILLAYVTRAGRPDLRGRIWWGVGIAVAVALVLGAVLTFGRYGLSFEGQELLGGSLSMLAVAMVTGMVFWMMKAGRTMKKDLEADAGRAMITGSGAAIFWLALVTVGREGLETTLMLWGWAVTPVALLGAVVGILVAVGLGVALSRGMLRINLGRFFTVTGALLVVLAAGILAYAVHDLQEARFLPGPFSGAPITPTDATTGDVLVGFTTSPFWAAAYPFGWAFDLEDVIDPAGLLAGVLKGTVGFTPLMSWLEVTAWALYLALVVPAFVRRTRAVH